MGDGGFDYQSSFSHIPYYGLLGRVGDGGFDYQSSFSHIPYYGLLGRVGDGGFDLHFLLLMQKKIFVATSF